MLYILYRKSNLQEYLFDAIKGIANIIPVDIEKQSLIIRLIRYLALKTKTIPFLPRTIVFGNKKFPLRINRNDCILLFDFDYKGIILWLLKHVPRNSIKLFYWNTISQNKIKKELPPSQIYTFDFNDSYRYNFHLVNQVYRYCDSSLSGTQNYDFFFIGANKGRLHGLKQLVKDLKSKGFSVKCIIFDYSGLLVDTYDIEIINYEIPYKKVIKYIQNSRVIIDYTKSGQSGYTLRILEGLFLGKKVLTNNNAIKESPLYKKENFFIYDNNISEISSFMESPYIPYSEEDLEPYDINSWIKQFM